MKQTYSFSAFGDWECPLRGKMKRIRKLQEPENPARFVGSVAADVMRDYRLRCWDRGTPTDFDYFNARFAHEVNVAPDEYIRGDLYNVMDSIRQSDFLKVDLAAKRPHVEQMIAFDRSFGRIRLEVPEKRQWFRDAFFRVKPDALYSTTDETAVVIDDKATYGTDADPFQLRLGAFAAARLYPRASRIVVVFQYLRFGTRAIQEFEPADVLEDVPAEINHRVAKIEGIIKRRAFIPDPDSGACKFCGFVRTPWLDRQGNPQQMGDCPAMTKQLIKAESMVKLVRLPRIEDEATAREVTRLLRTVEVHMDAVRDRLREYVEAHPEGRIQAGGVEARTQIRERWNVPDPEELARWLRDNHNMNAADVWPLLTTGKRALKTHLDAQIIQDAIDAGLIEVRPQSDFRLYKV